MKKLNGKSMNIVNENMQKLKEIFPEVFSEDKIDFEKLQEELGNFTDSSNERYNFTWNGKQEAKKIAQTPSTGTLRPSKVDSKNWDTTQNLYIEGDNLEVLKLLQKSYNKKVKMIYIDPPYNTGKDFVYKDNFKDNIKNYLELTGQVDSDGNKLSTNSDTSGRYHSDWLSMMYPRLKLARNLLKDDGVIFISIDDNEVANLRKLCDEIFGEDNFLTIFTVKVRYEGKTLVEDMNFQKLVENVLVYTKSKKNIKLKKKSIEYNFDKFEWDIEELEEPEIIELGGKSVKVFKSGTYNIIKKEATKDLFKEIWASGTILDGNSSGRFFRDYLTGRSDIDGLGTLYKVDGIGNDKYSYRYFTGPKRDGATKGKYYQGIPTDIINNPNNAERKKPITTFLDLAGSFGNCRNEGSIDFRNGKKPIILLNTIFEMVDIENNDIILDFFSGSSSTAHSIMNLNNQDLIKRRFIMVQLQEKTNEKDFPTICEIGKERIRRAGEKIKEDNPDKDLSNLDIGFKVFKLDSSNIKEWDSDFDTIENDLVEAIDNIKEHRTSEDLLYEILLKYGLDLTISIEEKTINDKKVFIIGFGALVVCLDENITMELIEEIAKIKEKYESETMRVVFKDSCFENGSVTKANAMNTLKDNGIDEVVSI